VAKSNLGKRVSSVGSQGGGKTYKKTRPANFYGALAVIVVLGLALTAYSRYEYQNPAKRSTTTTLAPGIGSVQYAALSIQDCGTTLPSLLPDETYKGGGFIVGPDDVVRLTPLTSADAGKNATLKTFAKEYTGLKVTSTELAVPKAGGIANPKTTFTTGEKCGPTTKYAGKTGKVEYAYWKTLAQTKPTITTNPASIRFTKELRLALAFEPAGVTPSVPAASTVDHMVTDTVTPTTTTTLPTTTTTVPISTTTGSTATTTTVAPTTTTTKG
jgi:hypothetical protein